jgi:hypothetical protein
MSHPNAIDYIEFTTTDLSGSKAFFQQVFGWEFKDFGPEYASFKDASIRGGFAQGAQAANGGPLVVLYAPDLDPVAAKVKAAGGTISVETFEFPGGKRFHFTEPGGNTMAVWSE